MPPEPVACHKLWPHLPHPNRAVVLDEGEPVPECPGVPNPAGPAALPDRHVVAVLDRAIVWRDEVRGVAGVDLSERERALTAAVDALLASRHTLRDQAGARHPLSRDERWTYDYLRRIAAHDSPRWDVAAREIEARVRADERRRVAEEIATGIEDLSGLTVCEWTRAEAAAVAREHAAAPTEGVQDGTADTGGTSEYPNPLDYCCEPLGCGHHINGHSHGADCTEPGCECRVWRDHVNCEHRKVSRG